MKSKSVFDAPLSQELIDILNELVPERCPSLNDTERNIFFYAGQRYLVTTLTEAWNWQKRNISNEELGRRKAGQLAGLSM